MDNNSTLQPVQTNAIKAEKYSFLTLLALVFLLPLLFIPFVPVQIAVVKTTIFGIGLTVSLALWLYSRIKEKTVVMPKTFLFWSLIALVGSMIIAGFASSEIKYSFFGTGGEVGTVIFVLYGAIACFLGSVLVCGKDRLMKFYTTLFFSFVVVGLYELVKVIAGVPALGVFTEVTAGPVGKWYDLGIFSALVTLISTTALALLPLRRLFKVILSVALAVALFILIVVNMTLVWYVLGSIMLLFLIQRIVAFIQGRSVGTKPSLLSLIAPFIIVVVAVVGLSATSWINTQVNSKFNVYELEVRPNAQATFELAQANMKDIKRALIGEGPNKFLNAYLRHKPASINQSAFWNTDFNNGVGFVPTFLITTGILGILAWLVFLISFLVKGIKSMWKTRLDTAIRFSLWSSFGASCFLWTMGVIYNPGPVIIGLSFLMTGVFISILVTQGLAGVRTVSLEGKKFPKIISGSIFGATALIALVGAFYYIGIVSAHISYARAVKTLNTKGNVPATRSLLMSALAFSEQDLFYRGLSELGIIGMNNLATRSDLAPEVIQTRFRDEFVSAVEAGQKATQFNPQNYQNWMSLAKVYETVVPLKVDQAYQSAIIAYGKAIELNPQNPGLYLSGARLEIANKNLDEAKKALLKALELKPNYTEAIFILSQIEVEQGNLKKAIKTAESAYLTAEGNPALLFHVGLLKYNDKDYQGAIEALSLATQIRSDYSNARYFLGLSLAKLGAFKEAIEQFEAVQQFNPDNKEAQAILQNLKAGRQPFAEVKPPADAKPEKRSKLPVKDRE